MDRINKQKKLIKIQIGLTPAESKRLIAKAVTQMPVIQRALKEGTIIIDRSTTGALILEELTGEPLDYSRYASGLVVSDGACATSNQLRPRMLVKGKPQEVIQPGGERMSSVYRDLLEEMDDKDVFIKSANALDSDGNVGVLAASPGGGIIGRTQPVIRRRQVNLIIPVGFEKLIPNSIDDARKAAGIFAMDDSMGLPCSLVPVKGDVITEKEAIKLLSGADSIPIAAGGVAGAEGAVVMVVTGTSEQIQNVKSVFKHVKGEKPIKVSQRHCEDCPAHYSHYIKGPAMAKPCPGFWE